MGCLSSKPSVLPSTPTPEKIQSPQPSQPIPIPDGRPSTPPPKPGTKMRARARAQSHAASTPSPKPGTKMSARARAQSHAALPRRRHDGGGDYPPPSSGGDVFTSQHPDRHEMRSRINPSGGSGRVQRTRAVSMETALQSASSHLSRIRNRTVSTGRRSRFPFALQSLLPSDFRYAV
jgi:hypothetical protein